MYIISPVSNTIILEPQKALHKLQHYCAYQERCKQDIYKKMAPWHLSREVTDWILEALEKEGYWNEERFAKLYVSGKFRLKKWGRNKIILELKQKNIPSKYITKALKEIDETDYAQTMQDLLAKKAATLKSPLLPRQRQQKLANYLLQKGYETELVWKAVKIFTK